MALPPTTNASSINNCSKITESEFDIINKAAHYNRDGAIECIDEMELIYGTKALMIFCLLSAHKYRYRANAKGHAEQDLNESDYYIRKYKEIKERLAKKNET